MSNVAKDQLLEEPSREELMRRNRKAIALVEGWLKEDPSYDLETLPLLNKALDASRVEAGARQLFSDEDSAGR